MKKQPLFVVLLSSFLAFGAVGSAAAQTGSQVTSQARGNLAATAQLSDRHTTLLQALRASGLDKQARGEAEQFTVFAPTNAAFDKLPAGKLDELLQPANKDALTRLLAHHVVRGSYLAANLKDGMALQTVLGETLTVKRTGDKVMIVDANGSMANVVNDDIVASNGIVHPVDMVLMPSPK